jgi:hypothetical protein
MDVVELEGVDRHELYLAVELPDAPCGRSSAHRNSLLPTRAQKWLRPRVLLEPA